MPTYRFQGLAHSPGFVDVIADDEEQARTKAEHGEWDGIPVVEDEPSDFTINDDDGPELIDELGDDDEKMDCDVCGEPVILAEGVSSMAGTVHEECADQANSMGADDEDQDDDTCGPDCRMNNKPDGTIQVCPLCSRARI